MCMRTECSKSRHLLLPAIFFALLAVSDFACVCHGQSSGNSCDSASSAPGEKAGCTPTIPAPAFTYRQKIADTQKLVEKARTDHNESAEAFQLRILSELQAHAGQAKLALQNTQQALGICIRHKLVKEAGIDVQDIGWIYSLLENKKLAADYYKKGLEMEEAAKNPASEGNTLNNLGNLALNAGQPDEAFDYYRHALRIQEQNRIPAGEARSHSNLAREEMMLGRYSESLKDFKTALDILSNINDRSGQAEIYVNLAALARKRDDFSLATKNLDVAIGIRRNIKDRDGEADAFRLLSIYTLYSGDYKACYQAFEKAKTIHHEIGDLDGEAGDYARVGANLMRASRGQESLEYLNKALAIFQQTGNQRAIANLFSSIGYLYAGLGDQEKVLDYFTRSRQMYIDLGIYSQIARTTSNLSTTYSMLGEHKKAVEFANKALALWREIGNPWGEALTLHTLGWIYEDNGEHQRALDYFRQALPIHRLDNNNDDLYYTLRGMGEAEDKLGDTQEALIDDLAALAAARECKDPNYIGLANSTLMRYWRRHRQLALAAFFGIEAVNSFQSIRKSIEGLESDQQAGFVRSKAVFYHELAEILVQQDRLSEAEQVLDLLKEEELRETVRGDSDAELNKHESLELSADQETAASGLNSMEDQATNVMDLTIEFDALKSRNSRSEQDERQLRDISMKIETENQNVSDFFRKILFPDLAKRVNVDDANSLLNREKSDVSMLQNTLKELGGPTVAVRVILGDEHAWEIVVTAETRSRYELPIAPSALETKLLDLRYELRSPLSKPSVHLNELYSILVQPIEPVLGSLERAAGQDKGGVPTILWSLDGVLRFLPMAALFDGQRYMVERFNNVLFTPESYGHMAVRSDFSQPMQALAMGLSKGYHGLRPLPAVTPELMSIVHDPTVPQSNGPLAGSLLEDQMFTFAALKEKLGGASRFPVVHIASHFVLQSRHGAEPFLLMGGNETSDPDGFALTLSRLEDSPVSFQGTQLLTLSACSTAADSHADTGMEIESMGMVAQRKNAEAVLATLWDTNDASTGMIMKEFYSRWVHERARGKAEALRETQLSFIHPEQRSMTSGATESKTIHAGDAISEDQMARYTHPYYWAPFVLTGNYK